MRPDSTDRPKTPYPRDWTLILGVTLICGALTYGPFLLHRDARAVAGYYDRWAYFAPMAYYLDYSIHHGQFPLWNPLIFCGVPFAANPQCGAFYPPNLLRSLLTLRPTPLNALVGLEWMTFAHLTAASVAAYFLARRHALSQCGALVTAIAYTFGAALTRRVPDLASFVCMAAWMPVLLLLLDSALRARDARSAWRWATGCGLAFGLSVLVGFPQLTLYMGLLLACYSALQGIPVTFWRVERRAQVIRAVAMLVWIGILAALVAAPLLLPAHQYAQFAPRAKAIGESYDAATFRPSPLYLLRGLASYPGITYPGSDGIRMAGTGAFLLAILSIFHRNRRSVMTFAVLFFVLLDCSLGERYPIGRIMAWLAPFKLVVPARASVFGCLMLALLAGFGADALGEARKVSGPCWRAVALTIASSAPILTLLWRWVSPDPSMPVSHVVWFIPAGLAIIMVLVAGAYANRRLVWLFPALVFAETLAWNIHYLPYLISIYPYPGAPQSLEMVQPPQPSSQRLCDPAQPTGQWLGENLGMYSLASTLGGYDPLYLNDVRNVACEENKENVYLRELQPGVAAQTNQRTNLFLKRRFWLAPAFIRGPLPAKHSLFPPTTAVYVADAATATTVPTRDSDQIPARSVSNDATATPIVLPTEGLLASWTASTNGRRIAQLSLPEMKLSLRHSALTLDYTSACSAILQISFRDTVSNRLERGFSYAITPTRTPRRLEYPLPDMPSVDATLTLTPHSGDEAFTVTAAALWDDQADMNQLLSVSAASPNALDLEVGPLPRPTALVFVESAYPGWSASIDGRPSPIIQANEAFQAVELPEGLHRVRFEYRSTRLPLGMAMAAAGWTLAATVFVVTRRRPPRITA